MQLLFIILELTLQVFAGWTLAYHFSLLIHLPARLILVPFVGVLVPLLWWSKSGWQGAISSAVRERYFLLGVASLSLVAALFTLIVSRPDADDLVYFHHALVQLQQLDTPFITTDTLHNLHDLPPFSTMHVLASYELFTAMTAALFGLDPLSVYHNASAFFAGLLVPVVYVLLYRQFRLNRKLALLATLAALIFLVLDGNLHRSFGNFALVRLWQGKAILFTLLVPLILLLAHRFLASPTFRNLYLISLASICAAGLSGSGLFMVPIFIFAIALAYIFSCGLSYTRLKRALILNMASAYCVVIVLGLVTGLITPPSDVSLFDLGFPTDWWESLRLVIGDNASLVRNLLILLGLPLLTLVKPLNRFFLFLALSLFLLFANPLLGPFWLKQLHGGAYWRLLYLFPLPWCAGLVVCGFFWRHLDKSVMLRLSVALVVILTVISAYQYSILFPPSYAAPVFFKTPGEYKLPPEELAFARSVSGQLQNRNLLAPELMVVVLGLINPTIKFEATRPGTTWNAFANINQEQEGARREAAQRLITTCARSPENEAAFLRSLETGVDAVILHDCGLPLPTIFADLAKLNYGQWREIERNNGYILVLRDLH